MEIETKPECLGFIMDGNRRWAREHGLETYEGHKQGGDVLRNCIAWLVSEHISHGVFYAFSTENWQRSEAEVSYLMNLFREWISQLQEPVRVRFIGRREDLPEDLQRNMAALEADTKDTAGTTIWVALSYGGRDEIVRAVNELVAEAVASGQAEKLSEESFSARLDTSELPDPDMIIRTSGEQRLSGFLTWKSTYSELHFIDKHWPALTEADFEDILSEYATRERRRGK
ncbi:di-trans,poly-cis-decaprenylcistransferase [Candidatus Kaiserbacteria bacterium]|nr:di-trans,poly-cis-decaprenylcistransferase [Candidatus Kaiserbacteria bacterium]